MRRSPKRLCDGLGRDIAWALRSLHGSRTHTVISIATLAIGIGATTLTFSILHGTLLRDLPFEASDELLLVQATVRDGDESLRPVRWSWPWFDRLRQSVSVTEDIAAYHATDVNVSDAGLPERVAIETISPVYFRVLGVSPLLGRTFALDGTARPGGERAVVLGHGLWVRRFGADVEVLGRTVQANGVPLIVIGVMPQGFAGVGGRAQMWITHETAAAVTFAEQLTSMERFLTVIARPPPGVTHAHFGSQLEAAVSGIARELPDPDASAAAEWGVTVLPLERARIDPARRRATMLLFGAVLFVLALVCVNVASLQLVRASGRTREFAVRAALGGNRFRLARQLLVESVLLAVAGGTIGTVLAIRAARIVLNFAPARVPAASNDYGAVAEFARVGTDATILLFALLVSVVAAIVFGMIPARHAGRHDVVRDLRDRSETMRRPALLRLLTGAQVALGLVLLAGSVLFARGLLDSLRRDVGVNAHNVITFWVTPPDPTFSTSSGVGRIERMLQSVSAIPGVISVSVSRCTPYMATCSRGPLFLEGGNTDADRAPIVGRHYIAPAHFRTLGIPLLRGRAFTDVDDADHPRVAIVSETAARRFWPDADPIGERIWLGEAPRDSAASPWEIVGVVGDVAYWPPGEGPGAEVYTPFRQYSFPGTMVMARTSAPPATLLPALRAAINRVEPELPLHDVRTIEERALAAFSGHTFQTAFLSAFALIALVLATVGTYGLASWSVGRRTREFGVRLAIGATPTRLVRMVIVENGRIAALGLAVGTFFALALARLLRASVDSVGTLDALSFAIALATLGSAALLAAALPATRAARTDPLASLQSE